MLALRLGFLSGRYYGTPWGRSVNEGVAEWPPAPFRLLRAIISAWFNLGEPDPDIFCSILDKLSKPPKFYLPPSTTGHVRHYMPGYQDGESNKVFNSFVAPQGPVYVIWEDVCLDPGQTRLLETLTSRLNYLGRSESWVEASIEPTPPEPNLVPVEAGGEPGITMLCPVSPQEWSDRRPGILESEEQRILAGKAAGGKKQALTTKERSILASITSESFLDALAVDTGILRDNGWPMPPASMFVGYSWIGAEPSCATRGHSVKPHRPVTLARYLVSSEVPPSFTELVPVAERARKILMGIIGARNDGSIPMELSGRAADGRPATGSHVHTYFLPEPAAASRTVTHLNLYCPAGFPDVVRDNLFRLEKIWGSGGHDIRLALLTTGSPADVGGLSGGQSLILAEARAWESLSPFIPSRHLKLRRSEMHDPETYGGAVEREMNKTVREELAYHGLPDPETVELLPPFPGLGYGVFLDGHFTSWLDFRTMRLTGQGSRGSRIPYGVRIVFREPVRGPVSLGYACHYGLGLFKPADRS